VPVTLNVYKVIHEGSEYKVGAKIVTVTQQFTMPIGRRRAQGAKAQLKARPAAGHDQR